MKIIAIEGLDKAGKHSAVNALTTKLQSLGFTVARSEFHRYDQPTGALIMRWLTKSWDVDQHTIELIMAADKQAQQNWFSSLERLGADFLILDRYTLSQVVYGLANGVEGRWLMKILENVRHPDIDIIIDIKPETSMIRKGKHNNGKNDKYESDYSLLKEARFNYQQVSTVYSAPIKKIVDGEREIGVVHNEIFEIVKKEFGL